MTQAISLSSVLRKNGHEVCRVIVGRSERRELPEFFSDRIGAPIDQVDSPNFVTDKDHKSVNVRKTIFHACSRIGTYRRSLNEIDRMVKADRPDVILNFYDFIGGIYSLVKRPRARFICIAHQYLAGHSTFEFPIGTWFDRRSMLLGNWITSFRSAAVLALSFRELPDEPGVVVVPPLLREEVSSLEPSKGKHLLVYMLNHGYSDAVNTFHQKEPDWELHCFWDRPDAPKELKVDDALTYHRLDGQLFLKYMSGCAGFLTTAGFESVCEAMYLGKPVMMMPVEGHYEQACNALDASNVGAGIQSKTFDLNLLVDYLPRHDTNPLIFRQWADRAEAIFLEKLTKT